MSLWLEVVLKALIFKSLLQTSPRLRLVSASHHLHERRQRL
jgi:hypothetical protein